MPWSLTQVYWHSEERTPCVFRVWRISKESNQQAVLFLFNPYDGSKKYQQTCIRLQPHILEDGVFHSYRINHLLADSPAAQTSFSDSASDIDLLIPSCVLASDADLSISSGEGGGVTGKDESVGCSGGSAGACPDGAAAVGRHSGVNPVSSAKSTSPSSSALHPAVLWPSSWISSSRTWISSPKFSREVVSATTKRISQQKTDMLTNVYHYTTELKT